MKRILLLACAALLLIACGDDDPNTANLYESCETLSCDSLADGCYVVAWEVGRDGTMCSAGCDTDASCVGDAACFALYEDPSDRKICYQRCDVDRDCSDGFICADADREGMIVDAICVPE